MDMKFKTIEQEEFVNLVSLNEKEIQNNEKLPPKQYVNTWLANHETSGNILVQLLVKE